MGENLEILQAVATVIAFVITYLLSGRRNKENAEDRDNMSKQLQEAQDALASAKTTLSYLEEQVAELIPIREKYRLLSESHDLLRKDHDQLVVQLAELKEAFEAKKDENKRLATINAEMVTKIRALEKDVAKYEIQIATYKSVLDRLEVIHEPDE